MIHLGPSTKRPIIGFIGIGQLGSMLVRKFVETRAVDARDILAGNRTPRKARQLADSTGIRIDNSRIVAKNSDVVFIYVPPLEEEGFQDLTCRVATKGGITEAGAEVIKQDAPLMFGRLFQATQARHDLARISLDSQA